MNDALFDDLTRSLEQAAAHARGETVPGLRVHVPRVGGVAAIQGRRLGLADPDERGAGGGSAPADA